MAFSQFNIEFIKSNMADGERGAVNKIRPFRPELEVLTCDVHICTLL